MLIWYLKTRTCFIVLKKLYLDYIKLYVYDKEYNFIKYLPESFNEIKSDFYNTLSTY